MKRRRNWGVLAVVVLTTILICVILLSENSSVMNALGGKAVSGNSITGNVVAGGLEGANDLISAVLTMPENAETLQPNQEYDIYFDLNISEEAEDKNTVIYFEAEPGLEVTEINTEALEIINNSIVWFVSDSSSIHLKVKSGLSGIYGLMFWASPLNSSEEKYFYGNLNIGNLSGSYCGDFVCNRDLGENEINCNDCIYYNVTFNYSYFEDAYNEVRSDSVLYEPSFSNEFSGNFDIYKKEYVYNSTKARPEIRDGKLVFQAGNAWNKDYIFENFSYERFDGLTFQLRVKPGLRSQFYAGFFNSSTLNKILFTNFLYSFKFAANKMFVYENKVPKLLKYPNGTIISYNLNKEYDVKIVLKANGADYYLHEVHSRGDWIKVYSSDKIYSKMDLVPGIIGFGGIMVLDNWISGLEGIACKNDSDGDGYGVGDLTNCKSMTIRDCDDFDFRVNPKAEEIILDEADNNCRDGDWDGSCMFEDEFTSLPGNKYIFSRVVSTALIVYSQPSLSLKGLKLEAGKNWNSDWLIEKRVYDREDGLTYYISVNTRNLTALTAAGWFRTSNSPYLSVAFSKFPGKYNNMLHGIMIQPNNPLKVYEDGKLKASVLPYSYGVKLGEVYDFKIVLREEGADYYYRVEEEGLEWQKIKCPLCIKTSVSKLSPGMNFMNGVGSVRYIDDWKTGYENCGNYSFLLRYCGDNWCDTGETNESCPQDCAAEITS